MNNKKPLVVCALGNGSLESFLAPQSITPFGFTTYECQSIEAYYHGLKIAENQHSRQEICEAKNVRPYRLNPWPTKFYVAMGTLYMLGSIEHYGFLKQITRAKLYAYRPMVSKFIQTKGPITMSRKGIPPLIDDPYFLPEMYARVLQELRTEMYERYVDMGLIDVGQKPKNVFASKPSAFYGMVK